MSNRNTIEKNFSRCAKYYDSYSEIQQRLASKLIANMGTREFEKILDIGCGTGNYTRLLRNRFPSSTVKALDMSPEMLDVAKRKLQNEQIEFIVADAETTVINEHFDLITSNACFQWLDSFELTLLKYKDLLVPDGIIMFSMFGPLTFYELSESLRELFKKDMPISSTSFITPAMVEKILRKYFEQVRVEVQIIKETYASLWQLLNTIKFTGARGMGICSTRIGKGAITELERIYKERFNDIVATYQVFYCTAGKKDK